ncbi:MAG: hypothetical protein QM803_09880 [Rhodocyclaceae bacterium]
MFYNARGLVAGEVDAGGYLTEYFYDDVGNRTASTRYAAAIAYAPGTRFGDIPRTYSAANRSLSWQYDDHGRLIADIDAYGTKTTYAYDAMGNVVSSTRAADSGEARTFQKRYDALGRVIAELSAEGSSRLTENLTQSQINAIWAQYGVKYTYDKAGHRLTATDAAGNRTAYYYNEDGALAYTVNALGEVEERKYTVLGQLMELRLLATRLTPVSGGWQGGAAKDLNNAVKTARNDLLDTRTTYSYYTDGTLKTTKDAVFGYETALTYNAFGEVKTRRQTIDSTTKPITAYEYDRRGLVTKTTADSTYLKAANSNEYDAFGRVLFTVDPYGNASERGYDNLGRVILVTDPAGVWKRTTYDAFDRILTQTDAREKTTTYQYDWDDRSTVITTPEGIKTTIINNRHGQNVTIQDDDGGIRTFGYSLDGTLERQTDGAGVLDLSSWNRYDAAGRLYEHVDAAGTVTRYTYDDANRVLTRTVDPDGLNLVTTYTYDAKGNVRFKNEQGIVTETLFDASNRVMSQIIDPDGKKITTSYTYDGLNNVITITQGTKVTTYSYDTLGRRNSEIVNGGLSNVGYGYDLNGKLTRKSDSNGTYYYLYDEAGRLVFTMDVLRGVTENQYDPAGRLVSIVRYAKPIDVYSSDIDVVRSRLDATDPNNQRSYFLYDDDQRVTYTVNAAGVVTHYIRNAVGDVVSATTYARPVTAGWREEAGLLARLDQADSANRTEYSVYDAAHRKVIDIDAMGYVTYLRYDGTGHVTAKTRFASALEPIPSTPTVTDVLNSISRDDQDRAERFVFDAAGQLRYHVDAEGYVTEYRYNSAGLRTDSILYMDRPTLPSGDALHESDLIASLPITIPGNAIHQTTSYDAAGRVQGTRNGDGIVTSFELDNLGNITYRTVGVGREDAVTTKYSYDAAGRLVGEQVGSLAADGWKVVSAVAYVLDYRGNRTSILSGRGWALLNSDDIWAKAERVRLGYPPAARDLTDSQRRALTALYSATQEFDSLGRVIKVTDEEGHVTRTSYDAFGNVATTTDARQYVTYYYYDALNRRTGTIDAERGYTETRYDAFGNAIEMVRYANAVQGVIAVNTRPAVVVGGQNPSQGAYVIVSDAFDAHSLSRYDKLNFNTHNEDAEGYEETFGVDAFGQKSWARNKLDAVAYFSYDHVGNLRTETLPILRPDASGQWRPVLNAYEYDAAGNRTRSIEAVGLPESRVTDYIYDKEGRVLSKSGGYYQAFDPITGQSTTLRAVELYAYDAVGRQIAVSNQSGARTLSYYDEAGRKTAQIDALGAMTVWSYDLSGSCFSQIKYASVVQQPAMAGGKPPAVNGGQIGPNDRVTEYAYNRVGWQTERRELIDYYGAYARKEEADPDYIFVKPGTGSTLWARFRTEYDASGNVVRIVDANSINDYGVESEIALYYRKGVTYQYFDGLGRVIERVDAAGAITTWDYSSPNRIVQTAYAIQIVPDWVEVGQRPTPTADPSNDRIVETILDRLGRTQETITRNVVSTSVSGNTTTKIVSDAHSSYVYDGLNNVIQQATLTSVAASGAQTWELTDFEYDAIGRQITRQDAAYQDQDGRAVRPTLETEYDGVGNVIRKSQIGRDASETRSVVYSFDSTGHMLSERSAEGVVTRYDYDKFGAIARTLINDYRRDNSGKVYEKRIVNDALGRSVEQIDVESGERRQVRFNAFGEIEAKGVNGGWQEFTDYDRRGNAWRSNSGDGVTKITVYDKHGNATLSIASTGDDFDLRGLSAIDAAASRKGLRTISSYDERNQLRYTIRPTIDNLTTYGDLERVFNVRTVEISGPPFFTGSRVQYSDPTTQVANPAVHTNSTGISYWYEIVDKETVLMHVTVNMSDPGMYGGGGRILVHATVLGSVPSVDATQRFQNGQYWGDFIGAGAPGQEFVVVIKDDGRHWSWDEDHQLGFEVFYQAADSSLVSLQPMQERSMWNSGLPWNPPVGYWEWIDPEQEWRGQRWVETAPRTTQTVSQQSGSRTAVQIAANDVARVVYVVGGKLYIAEPVRNSAGMPTGRYYFDQLPVGGSSDYFALRADGTVTNSGRVSSGSNSGWGQSYAAGQYGGVALAGYFNHFSDGGSRATDYGAFFGNLGPNVSQVKCSWWDPATSNWAGPVILRSDEGMYFWGPVEYGLPEGGYQLKIEAQSSSGTRTLYAYVDTEYGDAGLRDYKIQSDLVVNFNLGAQSDECTLEYRLPGGQWTTAVGSFFNDLRGYRWNTSAALSAAQASNPAFMLQCEYRLVASKGGQTVAKESGSLLLGENGWVMWRDVDQSVSLEIATPRSEAKMMDLWIEGVLKGRYYVNAEGKFRVDMSAYVPASGTRDVSYFYKLLDENGNAVKEENGDVIVLSGTIRLGATQESGSGTEYWWDTDNSDVVIRREIRYNAFGEVIEEDSGTGATTRFEYNTLGKLVAKRDPQVKVVTETGAEQWQSPVTSYGYDLSGRLVSTTDANGNTSTRVLLAGSGDGDNARIAAEYFADGGRKTYAYNAFGENTRATTLIEAATQKTSTVSMSYNRDGQLIEVQHERAANQPSLIDRYAYDALGNRIWHEDAAHQQSWTYYDSLGHVVQTISSGGQCISYAYRYESEVSGLNGNGIGGWVQTTTYTDGKTSIDHVEYFGRTVYHRDMGGNQFYYSFNSAGWLVSQVGTTGQNIKYDYYLNGYIRQVRDYGTDNISRYTYDNDGRRTGELYWKGNPDGNDIEEYFQNATIQYDALGRVTVFKDTKAEIRYSYDAVGNRRRVWAYYTDGLGASMALQDYWYKYDAMNRFTVSKGVLSNGAITLGQDSIGLTYDLAGQRTSADYYSESLNSRVKEYYQYSLDGYLTGTDTRKADGTALYRSTRTIDKLGRTTRYAEIARGDDGVERERSWRETDFDADNRIALEKSWQKDSEEQSTEYFYYDDAADSVSSIARDGVGALAKTVTRQGSGTTITEYTYEYWDGAKQKTITQTQDGLGTGTLTFERNANGYDERVVDVVAKRNIEYVTNAQGMIMRRVDYNNVGTRAYKERHYFYMDGGVVGEVSNDPASDPNTRSYAEIMVQREKSQSRDDNYRNFTPVSSANFDQNYQPINDAYPGAAASSYTAHGGEDLKSVARSLWGDEGMWYLIADANGRTGNVNLKAGEVLTIPNKVVNIHNNANTFRPYNPGQAVGDVNPTLPDPLPPPQKGGGCGGVGMIIMIVVAVVVSVFTAGAAFAALAPVLGNLGATIAAGAIAGAASSIASQGVGLAMGVQDKFNWSSVSLSALGGAVSAGVGYAFTAPGTAAQAMASSTGTSTLSGGSAAANTAAANAGGFLNVNWTQVGMSAAQGALSSATTQLLRGTFNWRTVGAASVGSGAGSVGGQLGGGQFGGVASAVSGQLVSEGKVGGRAMFLNTVGQSLGQYIAAQLRPTDAERQQAEKLGEEARARAAQTAQAPAGEADHVVALGAPAQPYGRISDPRTDGLTSLAGTQLLPMGSNGMTLEQSRVQAFFGPKEAVPYSYEYDQWAARGYDDNNNLSGPELSANEKAAITKLYEKQMQQETAARAAKSSLAGDTNTVVHSNGQNGRETQRLDTYVMQASDFDARAKATANLASWAYARGDIELGNSFVEMNRDATKQALDIRREEAAISRNPGDVNNYLGKNIFQGANGTSWSTGEDRIGVPSNSGTHSVALNLSTGTGVVGQVGIAWNLGIGNSAPTLAATFSRGGTVGTDFGPSLTYSYVRGSAGENLAGAATTVSAGATVVRGSFEGSMIYSGSEIDSPIGWGLSLGLKSPLPVYVGPIGSVVTSRTQLWGLVDGRWSAER